MDTNNLLAKLSALEQTLHTYSYEKLTASEASELKEAFNAFKKLLKAKVKTQSNLSTAEAAKTVVEIQEESVAPSAESHKSNRAKKEAKATFNDSIRFREYLKESPLTEAQLDYINSILASSDIHTRVSNEIITPATRDIEKHVEEINSRKAKKAKSMKTTQHSKSGDKKSSKLAQVDLISVLNECLGKKDLLEELIRLYKQNALEFIGQVKLQLQNLDFEGIRFAAHKIKSGLRMMQTQELLIIAEQIETVSKTDQDLKQLHFLFDCFVKEYPAVERAIDAEFKKLK